jgi:3-hydroxyisobutyrate dehydrogenase
MPDREPFPRVGFVGLGRMGAPMAERLAGGGVPLVLFDLRTDTLHAVAQRCGATAATSLAQVARSSDVVISMLPDGRAVRDAVCGVAAADDKLLDGLRSGTIFVDMGSSAPAGTRALGAILAERGILMLDAPVSGGVPRAQTGTLSIMVGGDAGAVRTCRPLFGLLAAHVFETGGLGSGHAMKALNNLVSAAGLLVSAEALLIGRRFGLDAALMIDVLNASSGRNNSTETKFKQFILSRSFASGFALDLMVKDLKAAIELAEETETPAPLSTRCCELWAAAQGTLEPGSDHTAVVRWLERQAGDNVDDAR